MEVTLIPLIWWGLVAVLVVVAAWFFGTLYRQRQTSNAHWKEQLDIIEYFSESVFRQNTTEDIFCLLYTSPSPRDYAASRMPSSA